jgi:hypothetical protein
MKAKKLFYIIEPIDVDNDKIPDGFLASQYRIDKYGNKIFTKNKYITFTDFKSRINKKKGGINSNSFNSNIKNNNKEVVQISKEQYIQFMNHKLTPGQKPPDVLINNSHQYGHNGPYGPYGPNGPNGPNGYNGYNGHNGPYGYNGHNGPYGYNGPNGYNANNGNTFMDNVGAGLGLGIGFAAGDALFDGVASFF